MPAARPQPAPPPASAGGDDAAAHPGHGAPAPQRRSRSARSSEGSSRRSELIAIAARSFRVKGFDATTTRDIASASGMQSGSPFYHFKSKGELLFAVMEEGMLAALASQQQALDALAQPASAEQRIHALALHHLHVLLTPGNDFIAVMLYEQRALSAYERRRIDDLKNDYERAWAQALQELAEQGRLRAPASLVRLMFFGALHGTLTWYDPAQTLSLPELAAQFTAVFVPPAGTANPIPSPTTGPACAPAPAGRTPRKRT